MIRFTTTTIRFAYAFQVIDLHLECVLPLIGIISTFYGYQGDIRCVEIHRNYRTALDLYFYSTKTVPNSQSLFFVGTEEFESPTFWV